MPKTSTRRRRRSSGGNPTLAGFGIRFLFALLLVGGVYNPFGYHYVDWAIYDVQTSKWILGSFDAIKALVGVAIAVGWIIYIAATIRSLGRGGMVIAVALFGVIIWVLIDQGWIVAKSADAMTYITIMGLSLLMALGMYWSKVWRKLTGQIGTADMGEDPDDDH